jgi:hypothetical protein
MHINDKSRMVLSATGIFVSYSIFGVLQEKITRGRYGEELNDDGTFGEKFTFTLALVGVQCLFNWLFAKGKNPQCFTKLDITTSSPNINPITMLSFQQFLSLGHNPKMQHTRDTMPVVHLPIC